jgi:hypothetical protein
MKKMTLKDYYDSLDETSPRVKFRDAIVKSCGVTIDTFYKWLNGGTKDVPKLAKEKISEISGIQVNDLFPNGETTES